MGTDGPDRGGHAPQKLAVKAGKRPTSEAPLSLSAPADLDAERDTLASLLLEPQRLAQVQTVVTAVDFHADRHRLIFEAMVRLDKAAVPIDVPLLLGALKDAQDPDGAGARGVIELLSRPANPAHVEHYARRVKAAFVRRTLYEASQAALVSSSQSGEKLEVLMASTEAAFQQVFRQDIGTKKPPTVAERLFAYRQRVESGSKQADLIKTNLNIVNRHLQGGMARGWFVVVLAPPKKGKTAFVMNNIVAPAMEAKQGASLYFGEMADEELMERWYAAYACVSIGEQKQGGLTGDAERRFSIAEERFQHWEWERHPPMPVDQILATARTYKERVKDQKLSVVVVDYVQLIHNGIENRTIDIEYTTRGLKLMAAELDCVVIGISQPTVSAARDKSDGLGLHDGRGAGSIAADCDLCIVPIIDEDGQRAGLNVPGARHLPAFKIEMGVLGFDGTRFIFQEDKTGSNGGLDSPHLALMPPEQWAPNKP